MPGRIRGRLTYANVIATIAIFIALGGGAYAALNLPNHSVRSQHIVDGQVRGKDVNETKRLGARLSGRGRAPQPNGETMIVLGIILIILGALLDIGILYTIGLILLVVGAVLWILGAIGRPFLGRRYYY